MSTFFYDLNRRLNELAAPKETLNEGVSATDYNPKSQGGSRKESTAKYHKTRDLQDAAAARRAGATQKELKAVEEGSCGRMEEVSYSARAARAGKDIGKPSKNFAKIAKSASERHGSEERGGKVAGAVLAKLRAKESVEEADMDEGNEFSGALAKARETGSSTFKVDGKIYKVTEAELDEREFDTKEKFDLRAQPGDTYRGAKGTITKTLSGMTHRRRAEQEREVADDDDDKLKTMGRPTGTKRAIGATGPTGRSKLLKKDAIGESDMDEDYDRDEYDKEGEMAKSQSYTIADAAMDLRDMLADNENLPEWVQKKITLAQEYIDSARDYLKANRPEDEMVAEKAVSQAQRRAAGIARAAQKGYIPRSELRGASKAMAEMPTGELKKFAKTKEKGLPEKVREGDTGQADARRSVPSGKEHNEKVFAKHRECTKRESEGNKKEKPVKETTVAGSVAPTADAPTKGKGSMQLGKGIYDSFNREVENLIAESMAVSMEYSTENQPSVTVEATDQDAVKLIKLLKMAGVGTMGADSHACPTCSQEPCVCAEQVDENQPDWPTNTETSNDALQYAGGLNKPKSTGQTTAPIVASQMDRIESDDDDDDLDRLREMAGIVEAAKPDYIDLDNDGDRKESMKKAAAEKHKGNKEVQESILAMSQLWKAYKA